MGRTPPAGLAATEATTSYYFQRYTLMANYTDSQLADFLRYQRQRAKESHKKSIGMGTMQGWQSAEILAQFDAAASRLLELASFTDLQQQFMALVQRIDPTATPAPVAEPATTPAKRCTGEQYERITKLLNHHSFSKAERTKGLLRLNTLLEADALAYIAELKAVLPSDEDVEQIKALLDRSCFTPAGRAQGLRKLAELNRAGAANWVPELQKLVDELEQGLSTSSTPAQQHDGTHPALVASPYDKARQDYIDALRHERIAPEERDKAMSVIDEWTEAELPAKTKAVRQLIEKRVTAPTAALVAA